MAGAFDDARVVAVPAFRVGLFEDFQACVADSASVAVRGKNPPVR
jgi:hypothetical protein